MKELKRLRELREARGLTLDQVAEKLGLRNQYISNYELGKRRPDYETLLKFAEFYNVSVDYILERNDDIPNQDFLRVLARAKDEGFEPEEIEIAMDFLKRMRERNEN